ncbi:hypothetical protein N7468_004755 [Penicillium chermesinum]|uniref:Uncharacterized protein n=1 Tax=Penicillium chermesinum TaxID=63820 RepID=A0A9W9P8X3_9EURO|nr:uncharacterized protein N7468_004755 [Penicillium chermesinum]KAJ5240136.1 hypothetical protein N7468_004755 [Penicillium chermesinum]
MYKVLADTQPLNRTGDPIVTSVVHVENGTGSQGSTPKPATPFQPIQLSNYPTAVELNQTLVEPHGSFPRVQWISERQRLSRRGGRLGLLEQVGTGGAMNHTSVPGAFGLDILAVPGLGADVERPFRTNVQGQESGKSGTPGHAVIVAALRSGETLDDSHR